MATEALRTVKDRFSEYVDRVEREHERVVVTRNGRPAAVLIPPGRGVQRVGFDVLDVLRHVR